MNRIGTYYNRKNEDERLLNGTGELEFLRTKQIVEAALPDRERLAIADVGGGTGPYAFWLAEMGHHVALYDLMPRHIEQATERNRTASHPLVRIEVADVNELELPPASQDVVLLLGPIYHLTRREDRVNALQKVRDAIGPDGVGFVAYISRFGSMLDGFIRGLFADPEYVDITRQDLETGVHEPNRANTAYFTDAYFHHPDEIEKEAAEAGLKIRDHVAVEGVGWLWQNFDDVWTDPDQRRILLEMVERTCRDRSLLGAGAHNILVVE